MKKPVPKFKGEAEEREFWQQHDSADYLDWSDAEEVVFFQVETDDPENFNTSS